MQSDPSRTTASEWPVPFLAMLFLLALASPAAAVRPCEIYIKDFESVVAKGLADHSIDKRAYDAFQKRIARAEAVCASGDDRRARALAIDGMSEIFLGADDAGIERGRR